MTERLTNDLGKNARLAARFAAVLVMAGCCTAAGTPWSSLSPEARRQIETDWERQEVVIWGRRADTPAAVMAAVERGRLLAADLRRLGAAPDAAAAHLEDVADAAAELQRRGVRAGPAWKSLYRQCRRTTRELAFCNPRLDFDALLFVKRQWPHWNHQCSHRVGEAQTPGANLCLLNGLSPDGRIHELLDAQTAQGGIGRPDLSFDGRRIAFPYAAPRRSGTPKYGYGIPGQRGGQCLMYDVWEVGVDGTGRRNLTQNPGAEDTEPCYLPDGRIAFMSSRADRYVQCGDWALVCGLYSMNADGGDVRPVTEPKEGEFYPSLLADGRLLYTRWDYVMKSYNVIQQLWSVNPDGTRAQLAFGDWFAYSIGPIGLYEARQIPHSSRVIAVGAAHHNTGVGPIVIADLRRNRGTRGGLRNVTPSLHYPEISNRLAHEVTQPELPGSGGSNTRSDHGWYSSPYPLTENHFLVCYSFEANNAAAHGYGLYLQDVHGNQELIYRDPGYSCYCPIPLRPRPRPPIVPQHADAAGTETPATVVMADVYTGLTGVPRGTVKHLRVLETLSKTQRTTPQRCDVGVNCGWDMRAVLGTVPVEADGSACFRVPPHRQLLFEALDAHYLQVRRMRNFVNFMPGETTGCVGCHEPTALGPSLAAGARRMALQRPASSIRPPPWGAGPMSFQRLVQPVLDRRCVRCHDGAKGEQHAFDLRGLERLAAPAPMDRDQGPQHCVSDAFLALLRYVSYVRVGGYQGPKLPLPPNATGSRHSKLMQLLDAGHYDARLPTDDWRLLAAWIDCNAPYYGSWDEVDIVPTRAPGPVRLLRQATPTDLQHIGQRREALQQSLPPGHHLCAYLNCGLMDRDGAGEGPRITQLRGSGWDYLPHADVPGAIPAHETITFDTGAIVFRLDGLQPGRRYAVGVTWWDYNTEARSQSVWAVTAGRRVRLLPATHPPNYSVRKQLPATVSIPFPSALTAAGTLRLEFRRESGANAVLSEIWLLELPRSG